MMEQESRVHDPGIAHRPQSWKSERIMLRKTPRTLRVASDRFLSPQAEQKRQMLERRSSRRKVKDRIEIKGGIERESCWNGIERGSPGSFRRASARGRIREEWGGVRVEARQRESESHRIKRYSRFASAGRTRPRTRRYFQEIKESITRKLKPTRGGIFKKREILVMVMVMVMAR